MRYATEPDILEADIAAELAAAHPHRVSDLNDKLSATGGVSTRDQARLIAFARKSVLKCSMAPKQVMSAMINCPNPGSWEIPFEGYTHLMQLFADLRRMRRSVLSHPLCSTFAAALRTAAVPEGRAVSLCLGHLDDCALAAARTALHAADCTTGLTINDSLFVSRRCPLPPAALVSAANAAASHALSFPVTFSFLPHLTKPTDPTPSLASLTSALTNADPSPPASGRSTPADPDDSRPASASVATPDDSLPDNTPSPPLSPNSDPPSDLDSNLPSDYSDYADSLPYNRRGGPGWCFLPRSSRTQNIRVCS